MTRLEKKMMADKRALEEQAERMNPLDGRGATPSMGLSQVRGGKRLKPEMEMLRESARMPDMEGGIVRGDEVADPFRNPFSRDAFRQGSALMEHLHKLHGAGYARSFHEGMKGGMGTGRYEGKGFWDDFKRGFNMVVEPVASVAKVVAPFLGHPEVSAGLTAVGYGKMSKMADELHGAGRISKKERSALQAVLDRHRGGMCGGMDWAKIARIAMPLAEQLLGMGLPKTHYNRFQKVMEMLQKKKMEGGMSRQVGGKKMKEEESDSEEEKEGAGEMPPLYAMKLKKMKDFPVNRGGKSHNGRKTSNTPAQSEARNRIRERAKVVKKVMAERNLSMIEASKVVKRENLY